MTGTVAVVDYGSGNLHSAAKALERAAAEAGTGQRILVTADPEAVLAAERVVLPGQGAFAECRAGLAGVAGMDEALNQRVRREGAPFLGICVGMQLMATTGVEHGRHPGLGWIPGEIVRLEPGDSSLKIPHMGWNGLDICKQHPVLAGTAADDHVYFVHSYVFACADEGDLLAVADYSGPVTAIVGRDNLIGTQFHPEKSQAVGLGLLRRFLAWRP